MPNKFFSLFESPFSKALWRALKKTVYCLFFFSLLINILVLTVPLYMLQIFDRVLVSLSQDTLILLTVICVVAIALMGLLEFTRSKLLLLTSKWFDNSISKTILAKIPDSLLNGNSYGTQSLRDIQSIRNFISSPAMNFIFDMPWAPIFLLVIYILHPLLGFIATLSAILLAFMAYLNEITVRKTLAEANGIAIENQRQIDIAMRNAEVIQAMGMQVPLGERWHKGQAEHQRLSELAGQKSNLIIALSKFIRLFSQLSILGVGAYLAIHNSITAGAMIAASIILSRALAPFEMAIGTWKQLVNCLQAYVRISQLMLQPSTRAAEIELPTPKGHLVLDQLSYKSPLQEKPILFQLNQNILPGEVVSIIGPSGAGKTTLARLIVGSLRPTFGSVRLDGANVYHWNRESFGQYVGYLPQDVKLFTGSVRDNIARFQVGDDNCVIESAQVACIHDMILKFPQGYKTIIGEDKFDLSAGQKQRIALARSIYNKPKLVVLDEPNSNLDHQGEQALLHTIAQLKQQGTTVILVTHRSNVLKQVDKIIYLENGVIQLSGPSHEVLKKLSDWIQQPINARK